MAVKAIPLADGDLHWVFPQLADPAEVLEVLLRADAQLRRLADQLGVRPGWTGSGLEYHRYEHVTDIAGFAETVDVSFGVELWSPRTELLEAPPSGPPWEVDAAISVRCDARLDCGMHTIEELPKPSTPCRWRQPVACSTQQCGYENGAPQSRSLGGVNVIGTADMHDWSRQ